MKSALSLGIALIAAALVGCGGSQEDPSDGHAHNHGDHSGGDAHHGDHDAVEIPETVEGIWSSVNEWNERLSEIVTGQNLSEAHVAAESLTTLLKALRDKSGDLPPSAGKRVEGGVNNSIRALEALHEAADAGKQVETEKQFQSYLKLMDLLKPQFPESKTEVPSAKAKPPQ